MVKSKLELLGVFLIILTFTNCGGGNSSGSTSGNIVKLVPQSGTDSYLFYGNSNHKGLGALKNIRVIDANNPSTILASNDDTSDVGRPALTTNMEYNTSTNSYKDLHANILHYVSGKNPYKISMKKGGISPVQVAQSLEVNISGTGRGGSFGYTKIDYLGSKQYQVVKNSSKNKVLITPDMDSSDSPLAFDNKTLLTLSYPSYGDRPTGYIVYDSNVTGVKKIQNCTINMAMCTDIIDVNSKYKFIGDIGGTTFSTINIDGKFHKLDKANNTIVELNIGVATPMNGTVAFKLSRAAASSYYFNGNSIYFVDDNHNISRYNIETGEHRQISSNGKTDRIRAFTSDMVLFAPTDSEMYAAKKDGTSTEAITISTATKLGGQKYTYSMAVGNQYIYNLFKVDEKTGNTTNIACILENEKIECKDDSMWSVVVLAKDGKLNFDSTIQYTPYAFVRVDDTDNFGGGTLKAIDPKNPMKDGITLGKTEVFNFQTFKTREQVLANANGGVVLYAKNDVDFRSDAYYMNLNIENSLVNLSNEDAPTISEINGNSGHCHGRYCTVCHAFAGGKIYKDKNGTKSAKNHNIRFEFEDGETIMGLVRKGQGENFNIPLNHLLDRKFTAIVVDQNNTAVVMSNENAHDGIEYFNCNFCHGRRGTLRHDAPNVITIED